MMTHPSLFDMAILVYERIWCAHAVLKQKVAWIAFMCIFQL